MEYLVYIFVFSYHFSHCPKNYTCLSAGDNPNYGYTNFDNFAWSLVTAFQLITMDFWENVFNYVRIRCNVVSIFYRITGLHLYCCWAGHFTRTVPLSNQEYKWIPANFHQMENLTKILGITCERLACHSEGEAILLSRFILRKPDKIRPYINYFACRRPKLC